MEKKILADFQICISVPLRRFVEYIIFLLKHQLKNKFENLAEITDENLDILYIVEIKFRRNFSIKPTFREWLP